MSTMNEPDITTLKETLDKALSVNGEAVKLRELLKQRLAECGWKDEVKHECIRVIKERGADYTSLEDVQEQVIPFARGRIPPQVKKELLGRIKSALTKAIDDKKEYL